MKLFLTLILLNLLFSCHHKKRQNQIIQNKPQIIKADTFMPSIEYQISVEKRSIIIPADISLDTFNYKIKNGKFSIGLSFPKLNLSNLKVTESLLRAKMISEKDRFIKEQLDSWEKNIKWAEFSMAPVLIYKDNKIVSYAFDLNYYDNILVRPYGEYFTIAYDLQNNNLISAGKYFKLKTSSDSLEISEYIFKALGNPPIKNELYFSETDFSIDDSVIYFFNDQYEFGIPFNSSGGVKKKYLNKFILDEFK
jgi:hypothetical protein